MKQCLMIQTKDKKILFTHKENFSSLAEFSKIFDAKISTVNTPDEIEVLHLKELVSAICENKYQKITLPTKPKRKKILSRAKQIQNNIKKSFLNGNTVSLKELKDKYKLYKLTDACLCVHLTTIRKKLQSQGYKIVKVGGGKYKLVINQ